MKLHVVENAERLSATAFSLIEFMLKRKRNPFVVLPTGNTPLGLYAEAAMQGTGSVLARARYIQLDEYHGIAADDRRSLSGWAEKVLLGPLGVSGDRLLAFDSSAADPDADAARMEREARRGGIDLALLGLGPNGHLGFNEPGSAFDSVTRVVALTPESIRSNAVYWGSEADVPRRAYTLGLGTLATAKIAMLLVAGEHKAGILARTLTEKPSTRVPATILRTHRQAIIVADKAAASALSAATVERYSPAL